MRFRPRSLPWHPLGIIRGLFLAPPVVRKSARRFSRFAALRLPNQTDGKVSGSQTLARFSDALKVSPWYKTKTVGFVLFVAHGLDGYALFLKFSGERKKTLFSGADFLAQEFVGDFSYFVFLYFPRFVRFRVLVSFFRCHLVGDGQSHFSGNLLGSSCRSVAYKIRLINFAVYPDSIGNQVDVPVFSIFVRYGKPLVVFPIPFFGRMRWRFCLNLHFLVS